MKIALIRLPATYADWYKRPALGIAYIAACLQSKGYNCKIFDAYFHSWCQVELLQQVKNYNPDVAGLTAMTHEINHAASFATQLKTQMNIPIIIGGCHVTALPRETLAEFPVFDYGIYGEGEKTIIDMLSKGMPWESKMSLMNDVKGLVFRDKEQIIVNEPRPFLTSAELDMLPYPAFDHYYANDLRALAGKHSYYTLFTSRGCPYNCAFCMQVLGRKVRYRSPQNIIQEMDYAIKHYGTHTFNFADEIFLFGNQHTQDLLGLFIQQSFPSQIRWSALTRANFVSTELITLAKRAGCFRLEMGVESGDNKILKTIGKGVTIDQIKKAVKTIKDAGISLGTYYILGHPDENNTTLRKTVDLAVNLNTDSIAVGLMVPYPGTKIFDLAVQGKNGYSLLSQNWSEYDKYGGKVLEIDGLPYAELVKWQQRIYLRLYLKNRRFKDCFEFFWKRRKGISFILKKKILALLRK